MIAGSIIVLTHLISWSVLVGLLLIDPKWLFVALIGPIFLLCWSVPLSVLLCALIAHWRDEIAKGWRNLLWIICLASIATCYLVISFN